MNKKLSLLFEIIIYLLFIISFRFYLSKIYSIVKNYSNTQGMGVGLVILLTTILFLIVLIILILANIYIVRNRKNKFLGIYENVSKFYKKKWWAYLITITLVLAGMFVYLVWTFQSLFIFHPNHASGSERKLLSNNLYKKVEIETSTNEKYSGWSKIDVNNEYTIIYFGGNAQSSALWFINQDASNWNYLEEFNVIMVDYPGYGLSSGYPNEEDIFRMSLFVYDYVYQIEEIDNTKIIIMGFSLGTGVATYVASQRSVDKMILIAPYTSMIDVANTKFPVFRGPLRILWRFSFDNLDKLDTIKSQTLIVYSEKDEVIKPDLSKRVSQLLNNSKNYIVFDSYHNEILNNNSVLSEVRKFITE